MLLTKEGKHRLLLKMAQKDLNGYLIAIGSGTTPPTEEDVSLENELYNKKPEYIEIVDNVLYISAFFDTTYIGEINEIGLLDAKDNMLIAREVLNSPLIKNDDNTLTIDLQIII